MPTQESHPLDKMRESLMATGRSPLIPESEDAYGWLVGSWDLEVRRYWAVDVSGQHLKGEVHAGWTLEGMAVQDVWIMPQRGNRPTVPNKKLNMYGTTLRVWDSSIHAWRIIWCNPGGEHFQQQIGRRYGKDVVQLGTRDDGILTKWRFTEITTSSFHWLGESLAQDGETWNLEGEFIANRI